jgi:cytochrome c peroxidase
MKIGFFFSVVVAFFIVFSSNFLTKGIESTPKKAFSFPSIDSMDEVLLGELLFNDPILSLDSSVSCASCHIKTFAFADTVPLSKGMNGTFGKRNAPSVMNTASRESLFWDGRATSLEHQMHFPVQDGLEMALKFSEAVKRVTKHPFYSKAFQKVYQHQPDSSTIVSAIAAFERSLETTNTPNDRWMEDDTLNDRGLTPQQISGRNVFRSEKAKCLDCHFTPDFTGDEFWNIGLFNGKELNDSGRFSVTHDIKDIGKFKVPGLRNVAVTAPYMHNGMFKTLKEVIEYYDNPSKFIKNPVNLDHRLSKPLGLSAQEKADLEAFLRSLTDDQFANQFPNR